MKYFLYLLSVILIFSCASDPSINKIDGTSITKSNLDSRIQSLVDSANVTGLAIAIFNKNEVVYNKAFGFANYEKKDSLKTNQVFYAASLSKAVFGFLVASLAEEGIIDLDKPLQMYFDVPIPELKFEKEWKGFKDILEDRRYEKITARMCLSHTTGFPNWRWISRIGVFNPEGKLHFFFDPGTQYSYSGEGLQLLQYAIEKITGKGLEQLAREKIFDPLKMNMTSYVWQKRFEGLYCFGHTVDQKVIPKDTEDEAGAAGSMETTLEDYSKFVEHVLKLTAANSKITNILFKSNIRIHSKLQFGPLALEETNDNDIIELAYGSAWGLLKSPYGFSAFKEGHGEGFQHYSIIFPEKQIGIILLSNSDNGESIFKELLEISIGDVYTPWEWENYIPFNKK